MSQDKGSRGGSEQKGPTQIAQNLQPRPRAWPVARGLQGTRTAPSPGLWLGSAREALIKEGPQQVFENLFLPTVL